MKEQGQVQALAEGAAAAQTKTAVATDASVMLSSLRVAAGTLGPPCICTEPCSASPPPRRLETINAKPSALLLAEGGGQGRQAEGISGYPSRAAPSGSRDPAGNSWARAALLVITN